MRSIIESEVEIEPGKISTQGIEFNIYEITGENMHDGEGIPNTVRYCDVVLSGEVKDIFEAFAILYDKLNTLLDRISVVSYGKSFMRDILSVVPASIKPNETFEIAIPQFIIDRKTKNIPMSCLGLSSEVDKNSQRLERLMRLGLNSTSEEEKYINYYSLLEEIARSDSDDYIINICANCNHKVNTGRKATNNFIKSVLKNHSVDTKLANKVFEIRNKIAHGGAIKDKEFYSIISLLNSHLEEICLLELERRLGITIINRLNVHVVDIPVITHTCICNEDGTFGLIDSKQRIPARFVKLPHELNSIYQNTSAAIGLPLDKEKKTPIINPFSWPEVYS